MQNVSGKERVAKEMSSIKDLKPPAKEVTLLSSLRWFNQDFAAKGISSEAVKAHLHGGAEEE